MEKQISIIIPTYNMEAYIGKCLDSLLIPEFDQVEVWVVNDGSKDRSSEIAHSYADRYPDSIHVLDKPNGNYGSCSNAALPLCSGRYIKILDADDTFDTTAFSQFVQKLHACDEDVVITNFITVDANDNCLGNSKFDDSTLLDITLSKREFLERVMNSYIQMHRISFKREVFGRFKYKQTEGISYTDIQWAIVPLAYCESFRCYDVNVYRYLLGREGQTMSPEQRSKGICQLFKSLEDLTRYYSEYRGDELSTRFFSTMINFQHVGTYFIVLSNLTPVVINIVKEYDLKLKNIAPDIYENLNTISYSKGIKYKVFKELRKRNYPINYKIPSWVNFIMGIYARLG